MKTSHIEVPNSVHLRSLLSSFIEDLSLPFLERRGKLNNHKSTVLEELQDVISELNHREKDLLTSVHIALTALDTNDKLEVKKNRAKAKLLQANEKMHHQFIEIKTLQDSLIASETKYENINKTLIETEELMLENSAELNRMLRERFREPNNLHTDDELELIRREYKQQVDSLQKKRWELEKENNHLQSVNALHHADVNGLKEKCEKLEARISKQNEITKENEKIRCELVRKIETLESQLTLLRSNNERLKSQNEKLEEDLSLPINPSIKSKPKLSHTLSLHSELESMNELSETGEISEIGELCIKTLGDESLEDILYLSPHKCKTPQTRASSLTSYSKLFSTDKLNSISVSPERVQRKKPPEEYFALAVQAVKMNSPHMDAIISASSSELYENAIKQGIPFHKWHVWIESQLNKIYVQTLYKKNKTLWRRYSGKVCLGR